MYQDYADDFRSFERDLLKTDRKKIKGLLEEQAAATQNALTVLNNMPEDYTASDVDEFDGRLTKVEKEYLRNSARIYDQLETISAQRFPRRVRK